MNAISVKEKMLYCPKCQREYEDGSQRFCNSDGGRLLSAGSSGKREGSQKGVFTSLLGRVPSRFDQDEVISPRASTPTPKKTEKPERVTKFETEQILKPDLKPNTLKSVKPEKKPQESSKAADVLFELPVGSVRKSSIVPPIGESEGKAQSRLVDPSEISSGRASLGDRSVNPKGRQAFSTDNPDVLIGQIIKGRYLISEKLDTDETSAAYSAEDKIMKGKKVVIRVLTKASAGMSFQEKSFAEERISLSHVNHPNVAKVIDSGDLPEGKPFIVTTEPRDNTVANLLAKTARLNPLRVARIVRQASYALSEVHQNGVLHRNLRPEHILLTVSDAGIEQVIVTDFCLSDGSIVKDNYRYRAPEQIGGQLPTFASDSFSLAVIAYRLLTKRFPFVGDSPREVLASQKSGHIPKPSELNEQLSEKVDPIILKALAFSPSERYSKSREFGELLFEALSEDNIYSQSAIGEMEQPAVADYDLGIEAFAAEAESVRETTDMISQMGHGSGYDSDLRIDSIEVEKEEPDVEAIEAEEAAAEGFAGSNESKWKNRSPEGVAEWGLMWPLIPALGGLLFLTLLVVAVWWYFVNQPQETVETAVQTQSNSLVESQGVDSNGNSDKSFAADIETPPPARQVTAPPKSVFFENSSLNLSGELEKKFLKFSVYYPENWQRKLFDKERNKVDDKFLDIAISSKDGTPIKQFIVSPYESTGTFKTDTELFVKLVEKSNKDTSEALRPGSFEVVSQGATTIQNGRWKGYQVNFESKGKLPDGKSLSIWGRRLWIPVQRPGAKTGFIITMLATSLADDVKSADDVGKKGDLARILQTFEPAQEF